MGAKKKRNYTRERAKYYGYGARTNVTSTQRKRRSEKTSRNRARTTMRKRYGNKALHGKDIHHKNGHALDNKPGNLGIQSVSQNRSNNKD